LIFLYFLSMFQVRYLFPRPLFKTPGLSIRGIGIREMMLPFYIRRPTGTGDYLFMIFHDSVQLELAAGTRVLPAGTMMLWYPKAPQIYGNLTQRWVHSWIHCSGTKVTKALRDARVRPNHPLRLPDPPRVEKHLFNLHEELSGVLKPDPVIICNTLVNLIREAGQSRYRTRRPPITEGLARAREILDSRYDEPLDLATLAAGAGLSASHFCVEFRRCFGIPPIAYLIERRMRVAAMLLSGTTDRIGEIGKRVGYPDPYYFSKHFKSIHGVSPSRLRSR